jgi:hypothetical protein
MSGGVPNFIFYEIVHQGTSVSTTCFIFTFIILHIGYTRTCVMGNTEVMKVFQEREFSVLVQSQIYT